ncbi:hypothetical protein MIND_01159600 [Mycena indigotica]|uniref:Uncharacterized protein n=1 Tax=Mycena indigotica TaxID=2126181 RepID=A0A8H6S6B4_9AGAR|nr:uncharacterized protein MIND_01159600 [Mycena indigotica]KAF7292617.1 hypothetical protein MIND_01159600 [Mycena indigotica]
MASTTTTTFDFGASAYPQSQRSAAAQRMRSLLLIPRGPAFRPRTTTAPTGSTTTPARRPFAFPVIEDDDSASDSEDSISESESDAESVQTAATSVASLALPAVKDVPMSKPTMATTTKPVTQYLYQGGRTGVVSGGVMLGGQRSSAAAVAKPVVPSIAAKKTIMAKNSNSKTAGTGWRAPSAAAGNWRRA